jgi:hypothetical protein
MGHLDLLKPNPASPCLSGMSAEIDPNFRKSQGMAQIKKSHTLIVIAIIKS